MHEKFILLNILTDQLASCLFTLALLRLLARILSRFAPSGFGLCDRFLGFFAPLLRPLHSQKFLKKNVCLNLIEML